MATEVVLLRPSLLLGVRLKDSVEVPGSCYMLSVVEELEF